MRSTEQQCFHMMDERVLGRHKLFNLKLLESRLGYMEVHSICVKSPQIF